MSITAEARTLVGPTPTPFTGDRAQAQRFLVEFLELDRRNRRHALIIRPTLRVRLALSYIHGPLTTSWRHTIRLGGPSALEDETIWDEFYDSFCTAWIDDPTPPVVIPCQCPPPPSVITTIRPTPVSVQTLVVPSIAPPPRISTPQNDHVAQRVEKRQRDYTSDEEETRRHKYPRPAAHAGPPHASPQLGRRSVPLPRKFVYRQRRATSAAVTSAPRFLVPYMPPPRRPPSPPGDSTQDALDSGGHKIVVEDDNTLTGGVKTLDISGFDSISARDDASSTPRTEDSRPQTPLLTPDAADSPPQTPPHAHLFPRHALERPRDPDELVTRTPDQRRRGNTRTPYPTTSRNHARHARQTRSTTAPEDTTPTPVASRHTRRGRRANAAAPSTSPPPDRIATRTRDRHVHAAHRRANTPRLKPPTRTSLNVSSCNALRPAPRTTRFDSRPVPRSATIDTPLSVDTAKTKSETNRANAAVELFLRQYDAARTTATPTPVPPDSAYDAVAQHLAYCLVTDPDTTRVTQPFTLQDKPRAVLLQWKKR
ncbi:hypothetical protein EDB89DRAFT_2236413 [Lactarius sanguifluus]|nr:hypothetical protein EDB89DRAFT_2236413 [Lactarius sanguifluus]